MTRCASASVAPNDAWFKNWNASLIDTGGGGGGGGGGELPLDDPPHAASERETRIDAKVSLDPFISFSYSSVYVSTEIIVDRFAERNVNQRLEFLPKRVF